jgi:hypothetical protein
MPDRGDIVADAIRLRAQTNPSNDNCKPKKITDRLAIRRLTV